MGIKDYIINSKKRAELDKRGMEVAELDKKEIERRKQLAIALVALPIMTRYQPIREGIEKALYENGYLGDEDDVKESDYNKDYALRITDNDIKIIEYLNAGIIAGKYKAETIRNQGATLILSIEKEMQTSKKRTIDQIIERNLDKER